MDQSSGEGEKMKRLAAYAETMLEDPEGRYFLRWFLEATGYFHAKKSASFDEAAFNEGKRASGGVLFALVLMCQNRELIFREDW